MPLGAIAATSNSMGAPTFHSGTRERYGVSRHTQHRLPNSAQRTTPPRELMVDFLDSI